MHAEDRALSMHLNPCTNPRIKVNPCINASLNPCMRAAAAQEHNKCICVRRVQAGWICLIQAAQNGYFKVVQYLLERGANINAADKVPHAPLAPTWPSSPGLSQRCMAVQHRRATAGASYCCCCCCFSLPPSLSWGQIRCRTRRVGGPALPGWAVHCTFTKKKTTTPHSPAPTSTPYLSVPRHV